MATNPVVSLPDADRVQAALRGCEFVVVSDVMANTDTAALAHVLLPALAWGEKDGMVTNSDRTISRQRPFLPPPGEARADWRIICDVARAMGFSGFDFVSPHEIFREHARLTAHGNQGQRALEPRRLGGHHRRRVPQLAAGGLADGADARVGARPDVRRRPFHARRRPRALHRARRRAGRNTRRPGISAGAEHRAGARSLAHHDAHRKIRAPVRARRRALRGDQHRRCAALRGARRRAGARCARRWGSMVVRVRTSADIPAGMVFAPIHWNGAFASDARVGALTNPVVDPVSGEPELKHTPVAIEHFAADWYGVMLTRASVPRPSTPWWVKVQGEQFVRYELAGFNPDDGPAAARSLLGVPDDVAAGDLDWIEYSDKSQRVYRAAWFVDDRIEGCMYIAPTPALPERAWLAKLFDVGKLDAGVRASLLAGRALEGADPGALVCSCFGVGRNAIAACARELGRAATPVEIGKRLKCGTNCGSCVAEIHAVIQESQRTPEKRSAS